MSIELIAPAREHFIVTSADAQVHLFLRSRQPVGRVRGALLAVHGATIGSSLFDVPFAGYSLLAAAADAGYAAYALDLRGYGRSSRPYLDAPAAACAPRVDQAAQVVGDVLDAVRYVCTQEGVPRLHLLGGSWGSIIAGRFCSAYPEWVDRLALMAPIYAEPNEGWLSDLADPADPRRPRAFGPFRWVRRADLTRRWDPEIPYADRSRRRDERVLDWLLADLAACEPAPAPGAHGDPCFRAPNGTLLDLFEAFSGRAQFDPARLGCPTLLIRGEHDGTSTRSDAEQLFAALGTCDKTLVTVGDAGHFLCVERRRRDFHAHVLAFLGAAASA